MEVNDQVTGAGGGRLGLLGRLAGLAAGVPRPAGIRNGGLLLILVGLAVVMALVDRPPEPVTGGRGGGILQYLPPPVGITRLPPVPAQPPVPAGSAGAAALAGSTERPASLDRAHPNRGHPRPDRPGSTRVRSGGAAGQPPVGGGGGGQGGDGTSPPVTAPAVAAPAVQVQVPPIDVRVTPPALLGRALPEVRVETPAVTVDTPAATIPRLRLG
jgi:hypothetical protein